MKKLFTLICMLTCLAVWQSPVFAAGSRSGKECTPTNIQYCKKGATWSGKKFTTYTVRCSDGTKRVISAWSNRQKWCVGESEKECSKSQLSAAKHACQK